MTDRDAGQGVAAVPLSVVIATKRAWPFARATLETLEAQVAAVGGEVLVVDGSGGALLEEPQPPFRWLRLPTRDGFALRAAGIRAARGDVVAIGEDHLYFVDTWASSVLEVLDRDTDAAGCVGVVRNVSNGVIDRATFWITLGPWSSRLERLPLDRTPTPGNVALRRSVFTDPVPGSLEYRVLPELLTEGRLRPNPGQETAHDQTLGRTEVFVTHFASGRAFGAAPGRGGRRRRLAEAVRAPRTITRHSFAAIRAVDGRTETIACRLLVVALSVANALGQVMGVLRGPGKTGERLV